jgi:hypothetical protein
LVQILTQRKLDVLFYLNSQTLNDFIYASDLQEEAPTNKNSKRKQVHEDLHFICMTHCREVKGREIVKEEIRRVRTGGSTPREIPFSIDVKGGERETLMKSDGHRGRMSMVLPCLTVAINEKGGDYWKDG